MPNIALSKWITTYVACIAFLPTHAQTPVADTAFYHEVLQTAVKNYRAAAGNNLLLYKGAEYTAYYPGTAGNPFFLSDSLQWGTVCYDGIVYPDLQLKYDLVSNELLLKGPENLLIKLAPGKIDSFSINGHSFVKLQEDSSQQTLPTDFYERLYAGKVTAWLKQRKQSARTFNPEDPDRFAEYDTYYLEQGGRYAAVPDEKSLVNFFGDQRSAVKKYLHKEGYHFKHDPGGTVVKAAAYYNGLIK